MRLNRQIGQKVSLGVMSISSVTVWAAIVACGQPLDQTNVAQEAFGQAMTFRPGDDLVLTRVLASYLHRLVSGGSNRRTDFARVTASRRGYREKEVGQFFIAMAQAELLKRLALDSIFFVTREQSRH